jgi:molybdate transport system ATP-binding protein
LAAIVLDRVTARISDQARLREVSLTINPGEHWAIVGANGSGKTALGSLLCNRLEILSGTMTGTMSAAFVAFETVDEILEIERYHDDSDFLDRIDHGTLVRDFLLANRPGSGPRLAEMASRLAFADLLERGIRYLSTGEMRKIVICRALLQNPEMLVLDEPFDGLDRESCDVLRELIADCARQGIRIVLLLNRFEEILPLITHVAYVRACSIGVAGPKNELLGSEALRRLHAFHYTLPSRLPEPDRIRAAPPTETGEPLVVMKDVVVRYGEKTVLNRLNWTVRPGEHWKITGPNGSGKSTLLSLVSGDHPQAYANDIRLFGRQRGTGESIWDIKQRLGLVSTAFQQSYRAGATAGMAVISGFFDSIGVYVRYTPRQQDIARQWLAILHMDHLYDAPLKSLSYGEQRMILLARAMVKQPRLLVLDEPCQGLDEINREMVLKLVDHLGTAGRTQLLYVTHHPEDHLPCVSHCLELVPAAGGGFTACIEKAGNAGSTVGGQSGE